MDAEDLAYAGAARQAQMVAAGEVSARELVETCLGRIERLDAPLGAFRVVLAERALLEADQADARRGTGDRRPMLGVPVAIKDNVDVAGETTTSGTRAHGRPVGADAELVRRLRAAGAIVVGKTHLPELALWPFTESSTYGVTRNPWDTSRTPGGSSGGAAAAVASGMVGVAQASDGGGSIRVPAACCGLVGLKPTRGLISLAPDEDHWHGLSVAGALSRTVADTALFLDVTAGGPPVPDGAGSPRGDAHARAAATAPARLRIAVSTRAPGPARLDPEVRSATEDTAELLRSLGHEVRERDPAYGAIGTCFTPRFLRGAHDEAAKMAHPGRLERRTRAVARIGGLVPEGAVARARRAEPAHAERIRASVFADHDVLLTPVQPSPAPALGRYEGRSALTTMAGVSITAVPYTTAWNALGWPAASVPAGFSATGLPLAVQLVAPAGGDALLLSLAAELEAARPQHEHRPAL